MKKQEVVEDKVRDSFNVVRDYARDFLTYGGYVKFTPEKTTLHWHSLVIDITDGTDEEINKAFQVIVDLERLDTNFN